MARQPRLRHGLISNAYTLELINLPYLFHTSGIPMLSDERDESWPVFALGGSNAMATQAIITLAGCVGRCDLLW